MPIKINIKHYRGDTYDRNLVIEGYSPAWSDIIRFGIREHEDDKEYLVIKNINPSNMHIHLTSEDTQYLPERCVYDIQITYHDEAGIEYTTTLIFGQFRVTKDVVR